MEDIKERKILILKAGLLIALFVLYCILRLDPIRYIWAFPEIRLIGPDSYYHLKRIIYTFEHFPDMIVFDNFLSYPEGDFVPWPPLFDFIGGLIAKIFGDPVTPSVFLPFIFGILFFFLIFFYQRKRGYLSLFISLTIISISNGLGKIQSGGYIDHHSLEVFLLSGFYLTYVSEISYRWKVFILSAFVTLSFFNWPGAPLYYGPLFAFILYQNYTKRLKAKDCLIMSISFFIAGFSIFLYFLFSNHNVFPYSFKYFSNFQRDFCLFASACTFVLYLSISKRIKKQILLPLSIIILIIFHRIFFEVFSGLAYLGKTQESKLMSLVAESMPLFGGRNSYFFDDFIRNIFALTPFYLLTPLLFFFNIRDKRLGLIDLCHIYFFLLTLFQIRMGIFYVPFLAIVAGDFVQSKITKVRTQYIFSSLLIILSYIFIFWKISLGMGAYDFGKDGLYETMHFLRERTKNKELFYRGETPYGVLSDWSIGHYIITLGNRPALAHNFIAIARHNKEILYIKSIFSKNEEEIVSIMDKFNAPYLVLSELEQNIINGWHVISDEENPYVVKGRRGMEPTDKVEELFLYKLKMGYPANNLRLIFEANYKGNLWNYYGVYERVKGAKIISRKKGRIIVNLQTVNGNFSLEYLPVTIEKGVMFVIPYALNSDQDVRVVYIQLETDEGKRHLNVTEEDVLKGREIYIN